MGLGLYIGRNISRKGHAAVKVLSRVNERVAF